MAILRRVWMQHDWWDGTQRRWREADTIPPAAHFISSPYDVDAHYARQDTTQWGATQAISRKPVRMMPRISSRMSTP